MRNDRHVRTSILLSLALAISLAAAQTHAETFVVTEPWVRLANDGRSAEAFMQLTSSDGAKLSSVMSFAAAHVSICLPGHAWRTVKELDLPAGQLVQLAPASYRIRLQGLTRKLKLGAHVPLTLALRNAGGQTQEILIDAEVRLHSPTEDEADPHHHDGHTH